MFILHVFFYILCMQTQKSSRRQMSRTRHKKPTKTWSKYNKFSTPSDRLKYVRICLNDLLGAISEQQVKKKKKNNNAAPQPTGRLQPTLQGSNTCTSKSFFFTLNELHAMKELTCIGCGHVDLTPNLEFVIDKNVAIRTYTPICKPCYQSRFRSG